MAHKNAARVLPLPVGAAIRTRFSVAICGQAAVCTAVGASNALSNHALTAGWNRGGKRLDVISEDTH